MANISENKLVNLVEFGEIKWWSGKKPNEIEGHLIEPSRDEEDVLYWLPSAEFEESESHIGVEWNEPRDVYKIQVTYKDNQSVPDPNSVRVEYWQYSWPTPAPEKYKAARRGWIEVDDPWHGNWVTANTEVTVNGNQHIYSFEHLDITEALGEQTWEGVQDYEFYHLLREKTERQLEEAEDYNSIFRKTLKVRLVFKDNLKPVIAGLQIYSKSLWKEMGVDIFFGCGERKGEDWSGAIEAHNGRIKSIEPLDFDEKDAIIKKNAWECKTKGKSKGIRAKVMYADCFAKSSDRTVITIRTKVRSFSFLINDLFQGPILIKDHNVLVKKSDEEIDYQTYLNKLASLNKKSIYDSVTSEPEQSYERVFEEIPPLEKAKQGPPYGRYMILGCEGNRQEFALRFNGHLFANKKFLKVRGHDTAKLLWPGMELQYKFGTGDPPDFPEREGGCLQSVREGYLPVAKTSWLDREIEYKEEAFAAFLESSMQDSLIKRGDEDIVCLMQFTIRNTTMGKKQVELWFLIQPWEELSFEGGFIEAKGRVVSGETVKDKWKVEKYEKPLLRGYVNINGKGRLFPKTCVVGSEDTHNIPNAILYEVELDSYEKHTINLAIPFATLVNKDLLSSLSYSNKLNEVISYWKGYINKGMQVNVPDAIINDFYKTVPIHLAISVDKDPYSGLYEVPAATYNYGPCGNEACWQIRQLDYRGYHKRAKEYLETFIRVQGKKPLDGHFKSKKGGLQALGIYGDKIYKGGFNYNLDHGFILSQLVEHYLLTRDREWLDRILPNLIEACDFIIRERASTMHKKFDGSKCSEYGLLPAGHLEDNCEWRYWFAVNAHAYHGMRLTAEVLAEINHPEVRRILRETEAYGRDIREAVERTMIDSPVVKLLDGTYIPHVPTRAGLHGRDLGWFREGAYGPLHLVTCDIVKPDEEMTTWILKDLEDNIFISREFGWPVDVEKNWFSQGGIAPQPNLLDNALVYLKRDQIEHGTRCFYNNLGASLYSDVRVFAEWVIYPGCGGGPFYKTPDECKFLNWLRTFLIYEEENKLFLAMGTPRKWLKNGETITVGGAATYFGTLSYKLHSRVSSGEIEAVLKPPKRNSPKEVVIRFRHPEKKLIREVVVNGARHQDYDVNKEIVHLTKLSDDMQVVVKY